MIELAAGALFALIIGLAIGIPVLIGGLSIAIKIMSLLFFTKVGPFPIWALTMLLVVVFIAIKKARAKGYGQYIP